MKKPLLKFSMDTKGSATKVSWNRSTASFDTVFQDHAVAPFHIQHLDENHVLTSSSNDEHKVRVVYKDITDSPQIIVFYRYGHS